MDSQIGGLSDFDRDEREFRWTQVATEALMPISISLPESSASHAGGIQHKTLGDLSLASWEFPALPGVRCRVDVRRGDPEIVVLFFADSGDELIDSGDAHADLSPEYGLMLSSSRSFSFRTAGEQHKLSLVVPRAVLEEIAPRLRGGDGLSLETSRPAVRVLREFLELLWPTLGRLSPTETQAARAAVLSLLSGAVSSEKDPIDGRARALRKKMDLWIDENLASGSLTVAELAAAHNVSVRTVHRVFADDAETVGSVVRRRRIARARSELLHSSLPISTIAARAGYVDSSHFAREFRRVYGETPRDHRARNARHVGRELSDVTP